MFTCANSYAMKVTARIAVRSVTESRITKDSTIASTVDAAGQMRRKSFRMEHFVENLWNTLGATVLISLICIVCVATARIIKAIVKQ